MEKDTRILIGAIAILLVVFLISGPVGDITGAFKFPWSRSQKTLVEEKELDTIDTWESDLRVLEGDKTEVIPQDCIKRDNSICKDLYDDCLKYMGESEDCTTILGEGDYYSIESSISDCNSECRQGKMFSGEGDIKCCDDLCDIINRRFISCGGAVLQCFADGASVTESMWCACLAQYPGCGCVQ